MNLYKYIIHDDAEMTHDTMYLISANTLDDAEIIGNFINKDDKNYSVSKTFTAHPTSRLMVVEGYSLKAHHFVPLSVRSIKIDNLIG